MKNKLKDIIKKAIDIHVHIGPEIIPRKYDVLELIKSEGGKIGGCVLKNHFYPTVPLLRGAESKGIKLFASITLNNAVGGLNPEVIYASRLVTDGPIMVWFPTINAENTLRQSKYEIPFEWVNNKKFKARETKDVTPVRVVVNNKLTNGAISVLKMIKQCEAILATGHISWKESVMLIEYSLKLGIKKIVITHPIYQKIDMPIKIQKKLANLGCFIEQCYSMYSIDKIPIAEIAKQIKDVGYQSVILSSDVGQKFSPSPSEALLKFAKLLMKEGITKKELFIMMVKNPKTLLGID